MEVQQEGKPPRFFPPNAAADQVLKGITGVEAGTLCQLGSGLEYAGNQVSTFVLGGGHQVFLNKRLAAQLLHVIAHTVL